MPSWMGTPISCTWRWVTSVCLPIYLPVPESMPVPGSYFLHVAVGDELRVL